MSRIKKLTPEEEVRLEDYREEYLAYGLATGSANMETLRPILASWYKTCGYDSPTFWHITSPLMANLVIRLLRNGMRADLRASLAVDLGKTLRDELRANLADNLRDELRANLADNLTRELWANMRVNLGRNLRVSLEDLEDKLEENLWENLGVDLMSHREKSVDYQVPFSLGSIEAYWIAFYMYAQTLRAMHNKKQMKLLNEWATLARNSGFVYTFEHLCIVCDRPELISKDEAMRLHNPAGPSVRFSDGWSTWHFHGVAVPEYVIMHPEQITVTSIDSEPNAEVRRVMIERYGQAKYILDSQAEVVHQDDFGTLYCKERRGDAPLLMVKVLNPTPDVDGTYRDFYLRVHHELRPLLGMAEGQQELGSPQEPTALNAVASTYGLTGEEYRETIVRRT